MYPPQYFFNLSFTVFASRRAADASVLIPTRRRLVSSIPKTMCPPAEFAIARTSFANSTRSLGFSRSIVSLKSRSAVSQGESSRLKRRLRLSSEAESWDLRRVSWTCVQSIISRLSSEGRCGKVSGEAGLRDCDLRGGPSRRGCPERRLRCGWMRRACRGWKRHET